MQCLAHMNPLFLGAAVMVTIPLSGMGRRYTFSVGCSAVEHFFSDMNEALSSIPSYFISKRIYMYIDIIVTFLKERCIICPPFSSGHS